MFYRYFRGRVDDYSVTMEQAAERMVPHLMRVARRRAAAGAPQAAPPEDPEPWR
jgi:biopolymer transport protein ExbB